MAAFASALRVLPSPPAAVPRRLRSVSSSSRNPWIPSSSFCPLLVRSLEAFSFGELPCSSICDLRFDKRDRKGKGDTGISKS